MGISPRAPPIALLMLMLMVVPGLVVGAVRSARAQDALMVADALAAQVEARAQSLTRASDLEFNAMKSMVYEAATRLDSLIDACAPFESLAPLLADLRVTSVAMVQGAVMGSLIDVESNAAVLREQIEALRARVAALRAGL